MPNLLNFFEDNGTFLSNNHTPLIAHTADDILTTYTGLYGDRQGMPVSNDYQAYNKDGPNGTFGTSATPVVHLLDRPDRRHDQPGQHRPRHQPEHGLLAGPAGHRVDPGDARHLTPAPWVPFTRAGCNVGDVATANQELENTSAGHRRGVRRRTRPRTQQLLADPDSFKDPETADYVGIAVHCAQGNAFCATAKAVKYGQTTPSPTAVTDCCRTSRAVTAGSRRCSGTSTSRRSSARASPTCPATATRSPTRPATWST